MDGWKEGWMDGRIDEGGWILSKEAKKYEEV